MTTQPKPFAILRVKPLRTWSAVAAMSRHGRREGADVEHFNQDRTRQNRYGSDWGDPRDIESCIKAGAQHHTARWRKGAPIASHLLLTASPSYFRPSEPDSSGMWEPDLLESWTSENLKWVHQRWPNQIACWRLDLDETTPHLDVFIVPLNRYKTRGGKTVVEVSHRTGFGVDRQSFARLQNDYARAMAPLGLVRGLPRAATKATHVNPSEYRRRLAADHNYQNALGIGVSGILRGDVQGLSIGADGMLRAKFGPRVPIGARHRFIELMAPAGKALIQFEVRIVRDATRAAIEMAGDLAVGADRDRREAADLLLDIENLHHDYSRRGLSVPASLGAQVDAALRQLVR